MVLLIPSAPRGAELLLAYHLGSPWRDFHLTFLIIGSLTLPVQKPIRQLCQRLGLPIPAGKKIGLETHRAHCEVILVELRLLPDPP